MKRRYLAEFEDMDQPDAIDHENRAVSQYHLGSDGTHRSHGMQIGMVMALNVMIMPVLR